MINDNENEAETENKSHIYNINRPRPRHGHKCSRNKMCLSIMMIICIKGALLGLRQFLATGSPLKMMKNAFCFTSKALFVLKIFKYLS